MTFPLCQLVCKAWPLKHITNTISPFPLFPIVGKGCHLRHITHTISTISIISTGVQGLPSQAYHSYHFHHFHYLHYFHSCWTRGMDCGVKRGGSNSRILVHPKAYIYVYTLEVDPDHTSTNLSFKGLDSAWAALPTELCKFCPLCTQPLFFWIFSIWSSLSGHCQRMIDGLHQGSPSYISSLTVFESNWSAFLNISSDRRPRFHHHLQVPPTVGSYIWRV